MGGFDSANRTAQILVQNLECFERDAELLIRTYSVSGGVSTPKIGEISKTFRRNLSEMLRDISIENERKIRQRSAHRFERGSTRNTCLNQANTSGRSIENERKRKSVNQNSGTREIFQNKEFDEEKSDNPKEFASKTGYHKVLSRSNPKSKKKKENEPKSNLSNKKNSLNHKSQDLKKAGKSRTQRNSKTKKEPISRYNTMKHLGKRGTEKQNKNKNQKVSENSKNKKKPNSKVKLYRKTKIHDRSTKSSSNQRKKGLRSKRKNQNRIQNVLDKNRTLPKNESSDHIKNDPPVSISKHWGSISSNNIYNNRKAGYSPIQDFGKTPKTKSKSHSKSQLLPKSRSEEVEAAKRSLMVFGKAESGTESEQEEDRTSVSIKRKDKAEDQTSLSERSISIHIESKSKLNLTNKKRRVKNSNSYYKKHKVKRGYKTKEGVEANVPNQIININFQNILPNELLTNAKNEEKKGSKSLKKKRESDKSFFDKLIKKAADMISLNSKSSSSLSKPKRSKHSSIRKKIMADPNSHFSSTSLSNSQSRASNRPCPPSKKSKKRKDSTQNRHLSHRKNPSHTKSSDSKNLKKYGSSSNPKIFPYSENQLGLFGGMIETTQDLGLKKAVVKEISSQPKIKIYNSNHSKRRSKKVILDEISIYSQKNLESMNRQVLVNAPRDHQNLIIMDDFKEWKRQNAKTSHKERSKVSQNITVRILLR